MRRNDDIFIIYFISITIINIINKKIEYYKLT